MDVVCMYEPDLGLASPGSSHASDCGRTLLRLLVSDRRGDGGTVSLTLSISPFSLQPPSRNTTVNVTRTSPGSSALVMPLSVDTATNSSRASYGIVTTVRVDSYLPQRSETQDWAAAAASPKDAV